MKNIVKFAIIVAIGLLLSILPAPNGLSQGWLDFLLFIL